MFLQIFSGLERSAFDNKTVSFEEHCQQEHNVWHYLYFIVLIKVKDRTEFTGPESYVSSMIKVSKSSSKLFSYLNYGASEIIKAIIVHAIGHEIDYLT